MSNPETTKDCKSYRDISLSDPYCINTLSKLEPFIDLLKEFKKAVVDKKIDQLAWSDAKYMLSSIKQDLTGDQYPYYAPINYVLAGDNDSGTDWFNKLQNLLKIYGLGEIQIIGGKRVRRTSRRRTSRRSTGRRRRLKSRRRRSVQ